MPFLLHTTLLGLLAYNHFSVVKRMHTDQPKRTKGLILPVDTDGTGGWPEALAARLPEKLSLREHASAESDV